MPECRLLYDLTVVVAFSVVGYETRGHGHLQRVLDRLREERTTA